MSIMPDPIAIVTGDSGKDLTILIISAFCEGFKFETINASHSRISISKYKKFS